MACPPPDGPSGPSPADVVVGLVAGAAEVAWWATGPLRAAGRVVLAHVADTPGGSLASLGERGRRATAELDTVFVAVVRIVLRRVVGIAVTTLDLTSLVRQNVDLDAVAADLDLDAAVARVDLDAAVARVDLDAAVARVDLDAAVARVDLDAAVARVDLEAVVRRLDLNALAGGIDIDPLIARLDVDAALSHFDLAGIVLGIIEAIDLPEIVRTSTGTLASETVRGVRAESMQADDGLERFVDRLLRRRRADGPVPT
jgi:hypothetical protein